MVKDDQVNIHALNQADYQQQQHVSEAFINEHIALIKNIASKLYHAGKVPAGVEFDDLINWGIVGLIKAKQNYKTQHNTKFQTYAFYRIKGEMLDSIRKEWSQSLPQEYQTRRRKLQETLSVFLEDALSLHQPAGSTQIRESLSQTTFVHYLSNELNTVASDKTGMKDPEVEIIDESYDELMQEINDLGDDEKTLMTLLYFNGLKQKDIANRLKISPSKVSRLHLDALKKLKNRLIRLTHDE